MENQTFVDQKWQEIAAFLAAHAIVLSRQGSVHESWRVYKGKIQGPYFRLLFRHNGKQESIYLGADRIVAEEVRHRLQDLQAPLKERRALDHIREVARAALRKQMRELDRELRQLGAYRKGFEIRRLRNVLHAP